MPHLPFACLSETAGKAKRGTGSEKPNPHTSCVKFNTSKQVASYRLARLAITMDCKASSGGLPGKECDETMINR